MNFEMIQREDAIESAASRLQNAEQSRSPCAPVRTLLPDGDVEAAYKVQQLVTERKITAGSRLIGRKIGLTSKSVRDQLGVDSPDYGAIFAETAFGTGEEISVDTFIAPKVEGEIALVLSRDIDVLRPTMADILRATDFVLCAIEIVESRILDWDIVLADTIADNASYGGIVLSGTPISLRGRDLAAVEMVLSVGGQVRATGQGSDCLGHPLNAAVWLARTLAERGDPLRAGQIVLTGALGPMVDALPGDEFSVHISGLGETTISFAEAA